MNFESRCFSQVCVWHSFHRNDKTLSICFQLFHQNMLLQKCRVGVFSPESSFGPEKHLFVLNYKIGDVKCKVNFDKMRMMRWTSFLCYEQFCWLYEALILQKCFSVTSYGVPSTSTCTRHWKLDDSNSIFICKEVTFPTGDGPSLIVTKTKYSSLCLYFISRAIFEMGSTLMYKVDVVWLGETMRSECNCGFKYTS